MGAVHGWGRGASTDPVPVHLGDPHPPTPHPPTRHTHTHTHTTPHLSGPEGTPQALELHASCGSGAEQEQKWLSSRLGLPCQAAAAAHSNNQFSVSLHCHSPASCGDFSGHNLCTAQRRDSSPSLLAGVAPPGGWQQQCHPDRAAPASAHCSTSLSHLAAGTHLPQNDAQAVNVSCICDGLSRENFGGRPAAQRRF